MNINGYLLWSQPVVEIGRAVFVDAVGSARDELVDFVEGIHFAVE